MPVFFLLPSKLRKPRLREMELLFHSHSCCGWVDVEVPFLLHLRYQEILSSPWNSKQMSRRPTVFERNVLKRRKQTSITVP